MNKAKTFAWVPFTKGEDAEYVKECEDGWGSVLNPGHLIIANDMLGWAALMKCGSKPVTLYVLGHGAPSDGNIYSKNNTLKTPDWIYETMSMCLNYGNSLHPDDIGKIKFYQCHGGAENGPAHEFKQRLRGFKNRIQVFGYTEVVWSISNSGVSPGRKYAGQAISGKRASSVRFEVQSDYHSHAINLDLSDSVEKSKWKCCS